MRTTTAYFAGVGTVAVAIAVGLGGGLLFGNVVAPHQPKYAAEPTKLEQRMADRTIPVTSAPTTSAPSEPTPYLSATEPAATNPVVVAAPQPQAESPSAPSGEQKTASNTATDQVTSPPQASAPAEPAAREPAASPRESFAKARDADLKRMANEKRRTERHPQWADKRRDRQPREQELEAVEQSVRDATEPRQAFRAEPASLDTPRLDAPRIRLFGDD
jgi:hypothetical protein